MDGISNQFQQRYQQLCARREAGQLSPQQFMAEVQKLRWQDGSRVWWTINPQGDFLRFDGQKWIPAQPAQNSPNPPPVPAYAPAASPIPIQAPPKPTTAKSSRSMKKFTPILALIPSLVCGGLWFLYTFIGVFKSGSIWGIDCLTPLIVVGLPVLFLVLKKPLDKLLLPLKPSLQRVPKPLRMGIALAVPLLLSCGCSTLIPSGYLALNASSFVSVMTAGVLLRF
jgi:hypothetical protein